MDMNYFLNLPVWKKLVTAFLLVGLVPMTVISIDALMTSDNTITEQVSNQLSSVRTLKANEVQRYFERVRKQMHTLTVNPVVVDAAAKLAQAYKEFINDSNLSSAALSRRKESVIGYYETQFGEQFRSINNSNADLKSMHSGLDDTSWALQYEYISNNSNALGEKHLLTDTGDGSTYSQVHKALHPMLRDFLETFGYYDIFLADPETGDIIYSVFKELDYTTSLIDGPYAQTSIGTAFRDALNINESGQAALADFKTYLPSYNAPASFIAAPVFNNGKRSAILIFQMPIEDINAIMGERSGMGETGESYLVGGDFLMRSDSFLEPEFHNVVSSFKNPDKGSARTTAVEKALAGNTGSEIITDYNGNPVLSAYMPLDLGGFTWAVLAEQDVAEAFAPAYSLRNKIIAVGVVCALLVAGLAYMFAMRLSDPITRVMNAISATAETGAFNHLVKYQNKDEIGRMAQAFDQLMQRISTMFNETNNVLAEISKGNYTARTGNSYRGDMARLCGGVNQTADALAKADKEQKAQQEKVLAASEQADKKAAEAAQAAADAALAAGEANRIRQALDVAGTAVVMADAKGSILYANNAMTSITARLNSMGALRTNANQLTTATLADFRDSNTGSTLATIAASASRQQITIGNMTFVVAATPIMNGKERIGSVVEWTDRTKEIEIEAEIDGMVAAATNGDFSVSLDIKGKEGFFLSLAKGLNSITGTTRGVIHDAASVMQAISEGDLTKKLQGNYAGTFAELTQSINTTCSKLVSVMSNINEAAQQVSSGAREIEAGIIDLASRTEQQAASLEETASSMNEMLAGVTRSTKNAATADNMAKAAETRASEGGRVVQLAVESMQAISSSSNQIADIIGVIDEIAFQTNLLALNAAVEAARAGEQGRGFAVVAQEVRQLAQRSSQAAKEIKDLINNSVEKVENGTSLVNRSGTTLSEIVTAVEKVSGIISELSVATNDQANGINQVNTAIGQMDEMTQQNSALVEEATAASENMAAQAQAMADAVRFFRIK